MTSTLRSTFLGHTQECESGDIGRGGGGVGGLMKLPRMFFMSGSGDATEEDEEPGYVFVFCK